MKPNVAFAGSAYHVALLSELQVVLSRAADLETMRREGLRVVQELAGADTSFLHLPGMSTEDGPGSGWAAACDSLRLSCGPESTPRWRQRDGRFLALCPLVLGQQAVGELWLEGPEAGLEALAGAQDALRLAAGQLGCALAALVGRDQADHNGGIDATTGLYQFSAFLRLLDAEFDRARRYRRLFALVAMAPDPAVGTPGGGTRPSRRWGALLAQAMRASDIVALAADGSFLFILPETSIAGARCVVDRLRDALHDLDDPDERPLATAPVTACFGLAAFQPADQAPRHVLQRAEAALLNAQRRGRDQLCLADREEPEPARTDEPSAWTLRNHVYTAVVRNAAEPGEATNDATTLAASYLAAASMSLLGPISATLGYAELLADGLAGPISNEQREHLEQLEAQARRLRAQVETMLVAARHDVVPSTLALERVVLGELCSEVVGALTPVAASANVLLAVTRDGEMAAVTLDPRRIRQALALVVEHAIKLTPAKERVEVRTYRSGELARIEVTAPLNGIATPILEKLFDERHGLTPQLLGQKNGFGFGIQFARRIVEAHGGSLGYDAGQGRHETLWIALPPAVVPRSAPGPALIAT